MPGFSRRKMRGATSFRRGSVKGVSAVLEGLRRPNLVTFPAKPGLMKSKRTRDRREAVSDGWVRAKRVVPLVFLTARALWAPWF
jgi:hypothetical protein